VKDVFALPCHAKATPKASMRGRNSKNNEEKTPQKQSNCCDFYEKTLSGNKENPIFAFITMNKSIKSK